MLISLTHYLRDNIMIMNEEQCMKCNKTYIRQYTDIENQPKPCPFCGSTHIKCCVENMDYIGQKKQ